jgi:hypothetical protein
MPQHLLSKSEYARHRGCTPGYVSQLLKKGTIFEVNGRIDPVDADQRIAAAAIVVSPSGRKPAVPHYKPVPVKPRSAKREDEFEDEDDDEVDPETGLREDEVPRSHLPDQLLRARIKREREEGTLKEIERKKRQGELIDAQEVKAASQARANAEREAMLAWPRRISADMAVDLGVEERLLLQVLQKYIRQHLTERSSQPLRQMQLNESDAA